MASFVKNNGSEKVTLNGEKVKSKMNLISEGIIAYTPVSTIPYNAKECSVVVYNNEIHILGGNSNETKHYKWDGESWTEVSTLPYSFRGRYKAVVFNNEIHILGHSSSQYQYHYKWNGNSWTSVSTLPEHLSKGFVVVYRNEIYALVYNGKMYKWNAIDGWTEVCSTRLSRGAGAVVVYDDKIHRFYSESAYDGYTSYAIYDGTNWETDNEFIAPSVSSSYGVVEGMAVIFNDTIYFSGSESTNSSSDEDVSYYTYLDKDGSWKFSDFAVDTEHTDSMAVTYNDEIHLIRENKHYIIGKMYYKEVE